MRPHAAILALLCLSAAPSLPAAELAGVTLADTVTVGGEELILNGLGLRKKAIFKVYVGGLYLAGASADAEAILAADAPRRMVMHFVRKVGAGQLCGGWRDGLAANAPDASAEVRRQFETLCGWMEDVGAGDRLELTYAPGEGTAVTVKGAERGRLEGKAFADALLACWLGPEPPSAEFRSGLLGG